MKVTSRRVPRFPVVGIDQPEHRRAGLQDAPLVDISRRNHAVVRRAKNRLVELDLDVFQRCIERCQDSRLRRDFLLPRAIGQLG